MDLGITGRNYYITGVSGSIGSSVARVLAAEGAFVHGCARGENGLKEIASALPTPVAEVAVLDALDVADQEALATSVARAGMVVGRLDGVVVCAGAGVTGSPLGSTNDEWSQQFTVKVLGALNLIRPAITWLEKSDRPRIVLINGVTAHHPEPDMAAVSACRAAVANLGRSLSIELAGRVGVVTVNLGAILTQRQQSRWRSLAPDQPFDEWIAQEVVRRGILSGRLGDPEEVGRAVAFLLSPSADYISGTSVDIAGGSHGRT